MSRDKISKIDEYKFLLLAQDSLINFAYRVSEDDGYYNRQKSYLLKRIGKYRKELDDLEQARINANDVIDKAEIRKKSLKALIQKSTSQSIVDRFYAIQAKIKEMEAEQC